VPVGLKLIVVPELVGVTVPVFSCITSQAKPKPKPVGTVRAILEAFVGRYGFAIVWRLE